MLNLIRPLMRTNFSRTIMLSSHYMQQQNQCGKRNKLPVKLQRLQKLFQEKNDLPVFLKGGNTDKILYYTTLSLTCLGLLLNVVFYVGYLID